MAIEYDSREERLAARFSRLRGLAPPVDVESIAKALGEVSDKRFPIPIDGLCLDLKKPRQRPKIWINYALSYHRRRFTLAHEIGHITIPWHTGSIVDELDAEDSLERDSYLQMEGEANRFAAELLMPKEWVLDLCLRTEHLQGVMRTITLVADVSAHAAAIRAIQLGPPGYLVARAEEGIVQWTGKTSGTPTRTPRLGDHIDAVSMPTYAKAEAFSVGRSVYYWWRSLEKLKAPARPEGDWRQILDLIVSDAPDQSRHALKQQLNAIVGLAFRSLPRGSSPDEMYYQLVHNLQNRSDHSPLLRAALAHPRFMDYALLRIYERADS